MITVHALHRGYPLCRFSGQIPRDWPPDHKWLRREDFALWTAPCDKAEPHVKCKGCERNLPCEEFSGIPIVPTEGRTCELCGAAIVSSWPADYCSGECALADSDGPFVIKDDQQREITEYWSHRFEEDIELIKLSRFPSDERHIHTLAIETLVIDMRREIRIYDLRKKRGCTRTGGPR